MLQDNARVSLKDIGAEVSMSPTAVGTRIDRMLAEGVLEGFTTKLNPEAMGHYIKAFINLEVSPEQKAEFYPYIDSVQLRDRRLLNAPRGTFQDNGRS